MAVAMRQLGVRRLVCQTGGMIGDQRSNRTLPCPWMSVAFARKATQIAADRVAQERVAMQSGLDGTIVKPPHLSAGPVNGRWQAGAAPGIGMLSSLKRANLSAFLLAEIERPQCMRRAVFVRGARIIGTDGFPPRAGPQRSGGDPSSVKD